MFIERKIAAVMAGGGEEGVLQADLKALGGWTALQAAVRVPYSFKCECCLQVTQYENANNPNFTRLVPNLRCAPVYHLSTWQWWAGP